MRVREVSRPVPHGPGNNTDVIRTLRNTLLVSALRYAERGMYVHPLLIGSKEPRWLDWEARATRDPELIRRTWGRAPFNIGVAQPPGCHTGEFSGGAGTYPFPSDWQLFNVDGRTPAASVAYVNEAWEVQYWTKALGVTEERLRQLVKDHGVMVADIHSALGR